MLNSLKDMQYKELFLTVFFFTFLIGTFAISIVSYVLGHMTSFWVTSISFLFALFMIYIYAKNRDTHKMSLMLLWSIAFIVFSHIFINHFNIDVVYILILPMTAPILLSRDDLRIHGTLYLLISLSILGYGFFTHQFNDPRSISSFLLLSFFVFLFGTTYHFAIEESYKKLEESNKQKAFLLKEIHHRVKNNLNIVASILGLEKFESNIEEVHRIINQNKLRIESIAMVHEILYESSDLEQINFKTYMHKLTKHILHTEGGGREITIHLDIVPLLLSIEYMMQFGIIINELITNSLKHAFGEENGEISITLIKYEHNYKLIYKDNGKKTTTYKKGFGTSLIEMSVQQLEGEMEVVMNYGIRYEITFNGDKNENSHS